MSAEMMQMMSQMGGGGGGGQSQNGKLVDFVLSWATTGGTNELIKSQNRFNEALAGINNRLRAKSNEVTAAWDSTKRWQQSVNNNRRLQAGGEQVTVNSVNTNRQLDVASLSNLNKRVAEMEQRGAAYAAQAASGVVGTAADMVNSTLALRSALEQEQQTRTTRMATIDSAQRSGDIMRQAVSSLDDLYLQTGFDYETDIAQTQSTMSPFMRFYQAAGGAEGMMNMAKGGAAAGKKLWDWGTQSEQISSGDNYQTADAESSYLSNFKFDS